MAEVKYDKERIKGISGRCDPWAEATELLMPIQRVDYFWLLALAESQHERIEQLEEAVYELLEVADLRDDSDLPHPEDDPKRWSSRMSDAWAALIDLCPEKSDHA